MRFALFAHSVLSDWNHGNAHFLRGIASELRRRGHDVVCHERTEAWSVANLRAEHGDGPLEEVRRVYPTLDVVRHAPGPIDLDRALDGVDVVLVHEWNDPQLVAAIGARRARGGRFALLFHDTHHRSVTRPEEMRQIDLSAYDGVLAFGETVREIYLAEGWTRRAWTWHEAADVTVFRPRSVEGPRDDLVWIGNWGDDERTAELHAFLLGPARALGVTGRVHGVRYPEEARRAVAAAGLDYAGWVPNFRVPEVFSRFRVTVHVPRRPYATALPGIPTIRPFEALACGIPLVTAPWDDREGLFRPGTDYLVARDGDEMREHLRAVLSDPDLAAALAHNGLRTVLARHTTAHRVDELLAICRTLDVRATSGAAA